MYVACGVLDVIVMIRMLTMLKPFGASSFVHVFALLAKKLDLI